MRSYLLKFEGEQLMINKEYLSDKRVKRLIHQFGEKGWKDYLLIIELLKAVGIKKLHYKNYKSNVIPRKEMPSVIFSTMLETDLKYTKALLKHCYKHKLFHNCGIDWSNKKQAETGK